MYDFLDFGLTFFLHNVHSGSCMITSKANSVLSRENETKIVKITHSALATTPLLQLFTVCSKNLKKCNFVRYHYTN